MRRVPALVAAALGLAAVALPPVARATIVPAPPPLRASDNVEVVGNVPGSFAGLVFKGDHAYATGWATGVTVFDISDPRNPTPVGALPLPHFENEDVDLCGDTLLIANDRLTGDKPAILHVVDISDPATPALAASLPLAEGDPGDRGAGHIANFVTDDCSLVWVDGGAKVQVIDLRDRTHPTSLGEFESEASKSAAFRVTHDTERDGTGTLWSTGGGGVAGYRLTSDPLKPALAHYSGAAGVNPSNANDFILHNSQRRGDVVYVTEEDYVDTDETPPGGCRGQGKFETWRVGGRSGSMALLDTWQTELNEESASEDSKAPITANCSSHWFDERGGVAAVGWYEQGVRFLDVSDPADIRQVGYYLPVNGSTWAAYWVPGAPGLVYTADVYRGLDVLEIDGVATPAAMRTRVAPTLPEWYGTEANTLRFEPSDAFGWACPVPVR